MTKCIDQIQSTLATKNSLSNNDTNNHYYDLEASDENYFKSGRQTNKKDNNLTNA